MTKKRVWAVYFSGTDRTKLVVSRIADKIAELTGMERMEFDFTPLAARQDVKAFDADDLVVFGTPVIAGRVPNVLLKYLATVQGNGALGVPVVTFGNRSFDNALIELRDIMENDGFHTIAGGGFAAEHSFSTILGKGRPDTQDYAVMDEFAGKIVEKLASIECVKCLAPVEVKGIPNPYNGYYQPRDRHGNPIDIRKVKPKTNEKCTDCKLCAELCPLGSINFENVSEITGICMKCCACVKKCPEQAKYFDDAGYLYHQHELEEMYERRAEPEYFL